MSLRRNLPAFGWSIGTWLALAGAGFGLSRYLEDSPWWWCLVFAGGLFAAPCGWKARRAVAQLGRAWRVFFWMVTIAAAGACVLNLDWQMGEGLRMASSRPLAWVAAILPLLAAVFSWSRNRGRDHAAGGRWWLDAICGGGSLAALLAVGWLALAKIIVPRECQVTEARWAAIGRPMPAFEATLRPNPENASIHDLSGDLAALGFRSFYRPRLSAWYPNTFRMPNEVVQLITTLPNTREDAIPPALLAANDSTAKAETFLNTREDALERLYADVLQHEPPRWSYDPDAFLDGPTPNYSTAREITQLAIADAWLKLQRGDSQAAATAMAADLRLWSNLEEQPTILASVWSHSLIQSLFKEVLVRLPADPEGLKTLASDVGIEREQLRRAIQAEYCELMRFADNPGTSGLASDRQGFSPIRPFREWLAGLFGRPLLKLETAKAWRIEADEIRITDQCDELASSDLGYSRMIAAEYRDDATLHGVASVWFNATLPNITRAWLRENFFLLQREQMELIRNARVQVAAGANGRLADWQSVVIPGSRWIINADAATHSVTLKLTPAPPWVSESGVVENDFFLLPLDGSQSWKFGVAGAAPVAER